MLKEIHLEHFKCFESLVLPLTNLTLLSGANGSGKSSVIQALVLLHQTMREHEWSNRLMLNGESLCLGTVADVVDKVHGRRGFRIGLAEDDVSCAWVFSGERSEMSLAAECVSVAGRSVDCSARLRYLLPADSDGPITAVAERLRQLTYITAERVGPREFYSLEDRQVATVVGAAGQHAVSVLHWGRDEPALPGLVLSGAPPTRLRQVEERMRLFFPGCGITVQQVPQANAVTLGIRTSEDTDFHRPIHVGFGLTQVLPIVIASVSARQGDLILIENPEVHLHPNGQALMGAFLAEVARAGAQVVVETHSDHVLNGIRRAVREQCLTPEQVSVHFFRPRAAGTDTAQVVSPQVDPRGNIDAWPDGFFDQFDKDANYFAGWES
jgi:predicted ATPase